MYQFLLASLYEQTDCKVISECGKVAEMVLCMQYMGNVVFVKSRGLQMQSLVLNMT